MLLHSRVSRMYCLLLPIFSVVIFPCAFTKYYLYNNGLAYLELNRPDCIQNFCKFVWLNALEDWNALNEFFIQISLLSIINTLLNYSLIKINYIIASLTTFAKVILSKDHRVASVLVVIVAALGALYRSASSPNTSPGLYSFKNLGGPVFCYRHD